MTFDMHHADEMNPVFFDEVKDFVRELANQCPSYVAVYDGVPKGILFNLLLDKCNLFKELKAKAGLPLVIPVKSSVMSASASGRMIIGKLTSCAK